ncbi:hypothetical protein DYB26_009242 [Aphanomyces astaci]|uniref:Uncharacterized protein n=1 Tax=Aphanomyces astaci TaxID=112090 RepID=A0A397CF90_APHAT|nr:hypothetical protein DYB38_002567 [Aphanomyces astaci]RHZ19147.1 hypothetical protein DYB26_009242 [Aphanomyces astaci]
MRKRVFQSPVMLIDLDIYLVGPALNLTCNVYLRVLKEAEVASLVRANREFWTEEDAAKGYDELVRMYLEPGAVALHFPDGHPDDVDNASSDASSLSHEWNLPDAGSRHADIIPPIQKYVDME